MLINKVAKFATYDDIIHILTRQRTSEDRTYTVDFKKLIEK